MGKLNKESPHILCIDTTKRSRAESTREKTKESTQTTTHKKKASTKHELAQNRIREKPVTEEKWITLRRIAAAHAECSLTLDYVPKQAQWQHWGERDRRARIKVKPETGSSEQMEIFHFNTSAVWCFMLCHSEREGLSVSRSRRRHETMFFFSPVKNDSHAAATSSRTGGSTRSVSDQRGLIHLVAAAVSLLGCVHWPKSQRQRTSWNGNKIGYFSFLFYVFLNSLPVHYFCSTWLSPSPLCCCFDSLFLNFIHFSTVVSISLFLPPHLQQQTFSLTKFSDLSSSRTQSELEEHEIRWRFVSDHTAQWLSLALDTTPPPGQHLMRRREHVKKKRER